MPESERKFIQEMSSFQVKTIRDEIGIETQVQNLT
jgi:hypothetical protein